VLSLQRTSFPDPGVSSTPWGVMAGGCADTAKLDNVNSLHFGVVVKALQDVHADV